MEDEELESFSTKRLNPFAVYMHKNKDSTDTDLENLNKRFKTEDKSADLGTSSVNVTTTPENTDLNIFKRPATITLSRNCPVPTERSFSNESHIFSSTRRDIETSPIKSSRFVNDFQMTPSRGTEYVFPVYGFPRKFKMYWYTFLKAVRQMNDHNSPISDSEKSTNMFIKECYTSQSSPHIGFSYLSKKR